METIINSMVEVFKTDVESLADASMLVALLQKQIINSSVNFDLEDCDKVLRIEAPAISRRAVTALLKKQGYWCELLE
ncbi:hypothetical protein MTO98_02575 [Mucilaginibacter sp. SMC90]|uniref:hypothetical protein n=1 Tax=Mucilaginibacter sp. SMC90 TaxID=2929803 RepID=UPI001FB420B9|nr:hypothetical protein [Mucilaginibacter sp. SMC90]UOE49955.1 hypothetical protein MTO98_02575 [Mucilaginibacter sp. SMC90]